MGDRGPGLGDLVSVVVSREALVPPGTKPRVTGAIVLIACAGLIAATAYHVNPLVPFLGWWWLPYGVWCLAFGVPRDDRERPRRWWAIGCFIATALGCGWGIYLLLR